MLTKPLFNEIVVIQAHGCQALLDGSVCQSMRWLPGVVIWSRQVAQVMNITSNVGTVCLADIDLLMMTETQVIFERTSICLNGILS